MKVFLATSGDSYDPALRAGGCRRVLFSFHYAKKRWLGEGYDDVLVDSGGFTARTKGVEIDVRSYAAYLNHYGAKFAFNLDTNDPAETQRNQRFLERETKTYIIPIYHMSDWNDPALVGLIDEFVERYPYISIGGTAKVAAKSDLKSAFYSHVFARTRDRVRVHGLGIGDRRVMSKFPFYSVDHTTWIVPMRYGRYLQGVPRTMATRMHVVTADKEMKAVPAIREHVSQEQKMTALWAARGVTWNDLTVEEARARIA